MKITESIIKGLRDRDEQILVAFYQEYSNQLSAYIYNFVKDSQVAMDLAFDLLMELPDIVDKYYVSYDDEKGFVRWLYCVARNKTINYMKHNNKIEIVDPIDVPNVPSFADESIIFEIEDLQNVMPQELYTVLYLKYVHDYRISEIEKILNLTKNQVKKRLVKARNIAKNFIEEIYKVK